MNYMDALSQYWADPETLIIPAGETDEITVWLESQSPDTWHHVVSTWNYDHGDVVLAWILNQDTCDRGTAANIFLVEGLGHWIWDVVEDEAKFNDPVHVCRIVLNNWHRYTTGDLHHGYRDTIPDDFLDTVRARDINAVFKDTVLADILAYQGQRDAQSKYGSEDGKIRLNFDYWAKMKGIILS